MSRMATHILLNVILVMLCVESAAFAEWVFFGTTDEGATKLYVDNDTIRRKGVTGKIWALYDYSNVQSHYKDGSGDKYLSLTVQTQFDCAEERSRLLALRFYAGHMGAGEVIHNDSDVRQWEPVGPGTVNQALSHLVCRQE